MFESLETDYGTDARDEIFKVLKDELRISPPLWLIIRNGLTVHDAVRQYAERDHSDRIFQPPFLHIVADTSSNTWF